MQSNSIRFACNALCETLAVYLPDRLQLAEAIARYDAGTVGPARSNWKIRVDAPALRQQLHQVGLAFDDQLPTDYIFHAL